MAVEAQLRAVREVARELQKEWAELDIQPVHVVLVDQRAGRHDPRIRGARLRVASLLGPERADLLLRHPDHVDPLFVGAPRQMLVRDVVLALPLLKAHHRNLALGGEPLDRRDELLADRVRQAGRRERGPPMMGKERGRATRVGQLAHVRVAIHPIDALQLEDHVLAQHVCGRQGYAHHQLRSSGSTPPRGHLPPYAAQDRDGQPPRATRGRSLRTTPKPTCKPSTRPGRLTTTTRAGQHASSGWGEAPLGIHCRRRGLCSPRAISEDCCNDREPAVLTELPSRALPERAEPTFPF